MRRLSRQLVTVSAAAIMLVGVYATSPSATAGDSKPCTTKTFHYDKVKSACKDGGQKAVKKLMKDMVKAAKAAGDKNITNCLDCHEDLDDFEKTSKAVDWAKPYLK